MNARRLRAIVAVAVPLCAGLAAAPADTFGVGILRRDGVIIPFAAWDGRRWRASWPLPKLELTVPVTLSAVPSRWWGPTPPLERWQVKTASGVRDVTAVQPDWVDIHCARQIGLRTDYRAEMPAPPRAAQPYPKDGLAISPPRPVDAIDILAPAGGEARELMPAIQTSFNDAERQTESRYGHPIARRAREGVVPTLEAVYAYGRSPRVYYVEAIRPYRQLGQALGECTAVSVGTGWFARDATGTRELVMAVDVLDCRRATASYMLPLGVLKLNDHTYWLAQFSGFDHERYVVLEIKPKSVEVVVNSWGGAC